MRNIVWNIKIAYAVFKNIKNNSTESHIYEEYRVEHRCLQKPETFIILESSGLPKAYRNQANTSSLGIALWNICGISKGVLLRAFEALGAAV